MGTTEEKLRRENLAAAYQGRQRFAVGLVPRSAIIEDFLGAPQATKEAADRLHPHVWLNLACPGYTILQYSKANAAVLIIYRAVSD